MAVIPLFTEPYGTPAPGRPRRAETALRAPASEPSGAPHRAWHTPALEPYGASTPGRPGRAADETRHPARGRRRLASVSAPPPATALALIEQARRGLAAADSAEEAAERYAGAHLAALRGAAAVVAMRGRPDRRRSRPLSVWALLASLAPELREWATFFAAGSDTRAAVQAGVTRLVSSRDADDLVRQAGEFIDLTDRLVRGDHR